MNELNLFPVQRVVVKLIRGLALDDEETFPVRALEVRSDGHSWSSEEYTEKGYVRKLFREGRCNVDPDTPRVEVPPPGYPRAGVEATLVVGRRAGKSYLIGALAALEMMERLDGFDGALSPVNLHFTTLCVNAGQASLVLQDMVAAMDRIPELASRQANATQTSFKYQTNKDIEETGTWVGSQRQARATLVVSTRTSRTKGLRGRVRAFSCMDEPDRHPESLVDEAWRSCVPASMGIGGVALAIGTPVNGYGWLRSQFENEMAHHRGVALRIPTWEMNPCIPTEFLDESYRMDPVRFMVEYGACFTEIVTRPLGVVPHESTPRESLLVYGLLLTEACGEVACALTTDRHSQLEESLGRVIRGARDIASSCGIDLGAR